VGNNQTPALPDVAEVAPATTVDLLAFVAYLRKRLWWLAAAMLAGLLLAFAYLNVATPKYAATLRVSPAAAGGGGLGGALGQLGGIAAMAGIDVRQGSSSGASPFDLYLDTLRSRHVADLLAKDQQLMQHVFISEWDPSTGQWRERRSILRSAYKLVKQIAGQPGPEWHPPAGGELADYLMKKVVIQAPKPKEPPVTTLLYEDQDPAFAAMLLDKLSALADDSVRQRTLVRATTYARYLENRLKVTDNVDQQRRLSEILLDQERAIMMAGSSVPFAATPSEPAVPSQRPVRPNVVMTLLVGLLVGAIVGVLWLFVLYLAKPQGGADQS
jgi:Chain length determinant protein